MMLCPQAWPMLGQGVVLAEHGDGRAVAGARPGDEGGRQAVGAALDLEALGLEHAGQQVVGEVLLEAQLGVGVDLWETSSSRSARAVDLGRPTGP